MAAIPSNKDLVDELRVSHPELELPHHRNRFAYIVTEPILNDRIRADVQERESQLRIILVIRTLSEPNVFTFAGTWPQDSKFVYLLDYSCGIAENRLSTIIRSRCYGRLDHRIVSISLFNDPTEIIQRIDSLLEQSIGVRDLRELILGYIVDFNVNRNDYVMNDEPSALRIGEEDPENSADDVSVASENPDADLAEFPDSDPESDDIGPRDASSTPESVSDSSSES